MIGSEPWHDHPAAWTLLAADKAGVVCAALDVFELPLDRGLIADEHQTAAARRAGFIRPHVRTKWDTGTNNAVPLHLCLAAGRIVTRAPPAKIRRVRTFLLEAIVPVFEVIVAILVTTQSPVVAPRRK